MNNPFIFFYHPHQLRHCLRQPLLKTGIKSGFAMLYCSVFSLFYQAGCMMVCLPCQVSETAECGDMTMFDQYAVSDV